VERQPVFPCIEGFFCRKHGKPEIAFGCHTMNVDASKKRNLRQIPKLYPQPFVFDRAATEGQHAGNQRFVGGASLSLQVVCVAAPSQDQPCCAIIRLGAGPRIALLSRLKCHTPPKFAAIIPPSRSASFPLLDRPMRKGVQGRMGSRAQTYFAAAVVCREQHRTASRPAVFV
jgi:hypothetical protein